MSSEKISRLKSVLMNLRGEFISDIPKELEECEICRETECSNDRWIKCENRLAHMKCLEELEKSAKSKD